MVGAAALLFQLAVAASAPDSATVRAEMTLRVEATVAGRAAPTIILPSLGPFQLLRTAETRRTESAQFPSSGSWTTVERSYTLLPTRAGTFTIPPFEVHAGAARTTTNPLTVVVRDLPTPSGSPIVLARARLSPRDGVAFHAVADPETVYVGQQATYQVGVFIDDEVRLRLRRNPEFIPPEPRSVLAYDLPGLGARDLFRSYGGRRYEVHVLQRAFFPLAPGRIEVPPARLLYSLPLNASFFSREESHTAQSEAVTIVALEPPADGRPADFAGAVGALAVDARVDSSEGRVGDPLVLTVRVSGDGNVKLLPRPRLEVAWASAVPAGERVTLDSAAPVVRGAKEFDWIITPRQAGAVEMPPVRYPYFNPYTERYEIALTRPESLTVLPGTLAATDTAHGPPPAVAPLAIRRAYRGPVGPPLAERPAFWLLALLAPLPALGAALVRRPRARREVSPAVALRVAARAVAPPDAAALRRLYVRALAHRVGASPETLTAQGGLDRLLRRAGVTTESAGRAARLLAELDEAAYRGGAAPRREAARRALESYRRVDREARDREILLSPSSRTVTGAGRALLVVLAAAAAAGPVALGAIVQPPAARLFAAGVSAYETGEWRAARDAFGRAAALAPRAPDAWANFGTAAWQASDSAAAAVGWQRAVRLEPLATDVRERLELLPADTDGSISRVPPVTVSVAAALGLALWVLAWVLVVVHQRRRLPLRWAGLAWAATLLVAVYAADASDRLTGRRLAVVADPAPLRASPALGAERAGALLVGEVARVEEQRGAWSRVALDAGRDGWIETDRLVPLHD